MTQKVRWGILGPGKIAHSFANDLKLVTGGELTAVASRNLNRATSFAETYGAPHVFDSYEAMLASNTIDVVYIATPHIGHKEWAIKAMEQGKHVLCEKPLGTSLSEVQAIMKAAQDNQVFLMEALWSRFNPTIRKIKDWVEEGRIGEVGYVHADFAFYGLDKEEDGRLLNPNLAGGSLLDIGIYPIFLSYLILGLPKKVKASANFYKTGVEVQTSMIFEYETAQAVLYSGLVSNSEMKAEIQGSKGAIFIDPRWHETQGFSLVIDEKQEKHDLPTTGKGYSHEIEEVHACLQKGKLQSDLWSHKNSIDLISLMDEIRGQTNIVFPFER